MASPSEPGVVRMLFLKRGQQRLRAGEVACANQLVGRRQVGAGWRLGLPGVGRFGGSGGWFLLRTGARCHAKRERQEPYGDRISHRQDLLEIAKSDHGEKVILAPPRHLAPDGNAGVARRRWLPSEAA